MVQPLDFRHFSSRQEENEFPLEGLVHDLGQHDGIDPWPDLNLSRFGCRFQVLEVMCAACVLESPLQLGSKPLNVRGQFTLRETSCHT